MVRFETKIGIVVRDDLLAGQALNVTAFLASGVAGGRPEVMGQTYEDGSGNTYLPLFRQPVLVYSADQSGLAKAHERALSRGVSSAVYSAEMFSTGNDEDNRAVVAAVPADGLDLVGIAVYGRRNVVDKVLAGLALYSGH